MRQTRDHRETPVFLVAVACMQLSTACRRDVSETATRDGASRTTLSVDTPPVPCARLLPTSNDASKRDSLLEPSTLYGAWSQTVNGLRGRLLATSMVEQNGRAQVQLHLEIENQRDTAAPMRIRWGSPSQMLELTLEDARGPIITDEEFGGSEHIMPPEWQSLPIHSVIRVLLSSSAYQYLPSGSAAFRPFTFQGSMLDSTMVPPFYVSARFSPVDGVADDRDAWTESLDLPRVQMPSPSL